MNNVELDNRLFLLQQRKDLTLEQRSELVSADCAYLQDRDFEAEAIVTKIEKEIKC